MDITKNRHKNIKKRTTYYIGKNKKKTYFENLKIKEEMVKHWLAQQNTCRDIVFVKKPITIEDINIMFSANCSLVEKGEIDIDIDIDLEMPD